MKDAETTTVPAQGRQTTMPTRRPREEAARLGDEIYERDIRPQVEADHHGEYVAIDVDSGSWAISDNLRTAAKRLRTQRPGAMLTSGCSGLDTGPCITLGVVPFGAPGDRGRGERRL